jgi:hypothetical protein
MFGICRRRGAVPGVVERDKLAQGLDQHGERARIALAVVGLLLMARQPVLDVAHLPLGGTPEPAD